MAVKPRASLAESIKGRYTTGEMNLENGGVAMQKTTVILATIAITGCAVKYVPELRPPGDFKVDWSTIASVKNSERYPEVWLKGPVQYLLLPQESKIFKHLCERLEGTKEEVTTAMRTSMVDEHRDGYWALQTMPRSFNDGVRLKGRFDRWRQEQEEELRCRGGLVTAEFWQEVLWQFWALRDPTPFTPDLDDNEYREEFYRRVVAVQNRITVSGPLVGRSIPKGYYSDQGMTYIVLGHPDRVELYSRGNRLTTDPFSGRSVDVQFDFDIEIWYYSAADINADLGRQIFEIPVMFARSNMVANYSFFQYSVDPLTGKPDDLGIPDYLRRIFDLVNRQARVQRGATREERRLPTREERLAALAGTPLPFEIHELASPAYMVVIDGWDLRVRDAGGHFALPLQLGLALFPGGEEQDQPMESSAKAINIWDIPFEFSSSDVDNLMLGGKIAIVFAAHPSWLAEAPLLKVVLRERVVGRGNTFSVNLLEKASEGLGISQPLIVRSEFSRLTAYSDPDSAVGALSIIALAIIADHPIDGGDETTLTVISGFVRNENRRHAVRAMMVFADDVPLGDRPYEMVTFQSHEAALDILLLSTRRVPKRITVKDYYSGGEKTVEIH